MLEKIHEKLFPFSMFAFSLPLNSHTHNFLYVKKGGKVHFCEKNKKKLLL